MKAVVWHDVGDIRLEDVKEPAIKEPTDAIIRITTSAICGTDLHLIRGTMPGMKRGTIIGHEGVGIVEKVGREVRNLSEGDRVVIPATIACGFCSYCRDGYYSQCDNANPKGKLSGTAFFGGPADSGSFHGMQAEKVRVPFANVGPVKLPDDVSDDQAIMLSDIFPTGYFGALLAEVTPGDTVAVFGCGPVGLFSILSAQLLGAGRVLAVDSVPSRLEKARSFGAETINFNNEDPVDAILDLTGGIGVDRAIDAVGVDAQMPEEGPAARRSRVLKDKFREELKAVAPKVRSANGNWVPGNGPSQVLLWATEAVAKAGTISVIGVYPMTSHLFPVGAAMNKNLTIKMGNCNHRTYIPHLLQLVRSGAVDPTMVVTQKERIHDTIEAYQAFDRRESDWIKVELAMQAV